MAYDPLSRVPAAGTVTTTMLGGDVTTLAKDLLTKGTTDEAKTTLAVRDSRVPVVTLGSTP